MSGQNNPEHPTSDTQVLRDALTRICRFESRLRYTRGSFISALQVAYARTDGSDAEFVEAVDDLCADLRQLASAVESVDVTTHHTACRTGYSPHCREPVHDVDGINYCDLCGLWEGAR